MRVATVDGLVTLFYDGSKELYNRNLHEEWLDESSVQDKEDWEEWNLSNECKLYLRERQSWQQIIVVEGVTDIPESIFNYCESIKRVVMTDTVLRIENFAFAGCRGLVYIKLSINLEYIGRRAFRDCNLFSVFIPPTCRDIGEAAFASNKNLTIFSVS